MNAPDFISHNHGTIVSLIPLTDRAGYWAREEVPGFTCVGAAIDIDHRFFFDIACGLMADGLTMQDGTTGRMASLPESEAMPVQTAAEYAEATLKAKT